ncbi:hypothetical protein PQX77_019615 [Marasmius sp. AFHP31]|nr:hypothetical protein PQX77_019615 [Marasmius sp. AFHP31]
MSDFFANAHNFSINGGTFSGVNGDQHNHYYERTLQASHLSTSRSGSVTQGTSSRAITTTIHINGNQINNQIIEREEKELTKFDDNQWKCDYKEMWIDPTRGVVCRGPKGPYSFIFMTELEIKDLPPTAELLQEEVLVHFLGCQKSREADGALMTAMYWASNDREVPE